MLVWVGNAHVGEFTPRVSALTLWFQAIID
jgi:hypothetical protein